MAVSGRPLSENEGGGAVGCVLKCTAYFDCVQLCDFLCSVLNFFSPDVAVGVHCTPVTVPTMGGTGRLSSF